MISLFAIGDMGAPTFIRSKVAQILKTQKKTAVIGLGDNFYNYGIDCSTSPRWRTEFLDVFRPDCPWYMILGNHDYLGNIQAQMDFTLQNSFWKMPSRYYDQKIMFPKLNEYVHLFCLDTFELSPTESKANSLGMGSNYSSLASRFDPQKQLTWFEQQLANSSATWKIVAGHYPVFSCGAHGDNQELRDILLPLFQKYQVDFYVSGHDHNLQHTTCLNTQFLVSGTGSFLSQTCQDKRFFPIPQVPGVSFFNFWPNKAMFGFLGDKNQKIYEKTAIPNLTKYSFSSS